MELSGGEEPIPVIGVLKKDLPNNQHFLITEAYYQKLNQMEAGLSAQSMETGPGPGRLAPVRRSAA